MSQQNFPKDPKAECDGDDENLSIVSIKTKSKLRQLLRDLNELPTDSPSIYLDASGIGNDRVIDLQLFVPLAKTLYLVGLQRLGDSAFSTVGHNESSLRLLLESKHVRKIGFDVRDLSRLLFLHYNISLTGIYDVQLMELASRKEGQSKKFLSGLTRCIDQDIPSSNAQKIRWLNPGDTSNLHLYNTLGHVPINTMKRVEIFPILWSVYHRKLGRPKNEVWLHLVQQESEQRVHDSKMNAGLSHNKRWGPQVFWNNEQREAAIDAWNDGKLLEERSVGIEFGDD